MRDAPRVQPETRTCTLQQHLPCNNHLAAASLISCASLAAAMTLRPVVHG